MRALPTRRAGAARAPRQGAIRSRRPRSRSTCARRGPRPSFANPSAGCPPPSARWRATFGLAAPVLQQQVRADPVEPRKRALARGVERLAPLERDPEEVAHQPFRDLRARPAPQEAQQGGRVAVVDQPERLGLGRRSADHLRVRRITHLLFFPDRGVRFAGRALLARYGIRDGRSGSVHLALWGGFCKFERVQAAFDECWIWSRFVRELDPISTNSAQNGASKGPLSDRCPWRSSGDVAASTNLITQRSLVQIQPPQPPSRTPLRCSASLRGSAGSSAEPLL